MGGGARPFGSFPKKTSILGNPVTPKGIPSIKMVRKVTVSPKGSPVTPITFFSPNFSPEGAEVLLD